MRYSNTKLWVGYYQRLTASNLVPVLALWTRMPCHHSPVPNHPHRKMQNRRATVLPACMTVIADKPIRGLHTKIKFDGKYKMMWYYMSHVPMNCYINIYVIIMFIIACQKLSIVQWVPVDMAARTMLHMSEYLMPPPISLGYWKVQTKSSKPKALYTIYITDTMYKTL